MMSNLAGDTVYTYRINSGKTYTFKTPPAGGTLRFATGGDPHFGNHKSDLGATLDILRLLTADQGEYGLFISLGDTADHSFQDSTWKAMFDACTPYTTKIPYRALVGNHDTLLSGEGRYEEYMYPKEMTLQTGTRLYYRVDVGKVHFFMLDL